MNRRFFNKALYINTFLRLKITAILFIVICILSSVIYPINIYFELKKAQSISPELSNIPISQVTFILLVFMYLGVMVLSFMGFSFLNKRKSSDFYHSLSNTKTCTYVSIALAVLSWIYITIISTVLITSLTYIALGLTLNPTYPLYLILTYLSCSTLVASACFIAISITGTRFTNIILTGLVLMLPRFILFILKMAVTIVAINSTGNELGALFDYKYNLPFAFVTPIFNFFNRRGFNHSLSELFTSPSGIIYTFVLGLIYLVLACFLFNKRKSEIAEKSAPNKLLQHIYRMSITLPIMLLFILVYVVNINKLVANSILFLLSIVVYFVYELITTKKLKNLIKAIPLYLVLLLLTVGLSISSKAIGEKILKVAPSPDEIKSISILGEYLSYTSDYLEIQTGKIQYSDNEMINLISSSLKENIENYNLTKYCDYPNQSNTSEYYSFHLKNGKTITKQIWLTKKNENLLYNFKIKNNEYTKLCRKLPSEKEISKININQLSEKESKIIWESFIKEIQTLNDEEYKYVNRSTLYIDNIYNNTSKYYSDNIYNQTNNFNHIIDISISGNVGVSNFHSSYIISNYTPKTANLYFSMVNNKVKDNLKSEIQKIINCDSQEPEYFNYQISINSYDNNKECYNNTSFYGNSHTENEPSELSVENSKQLFSIIDNIEYENAELGKSYASINIRSQRNDLFCFIALSDEDISKIMDIYNKNIKDTK